MTPRPTRRQKEHRRDSNKAREFFDTKADKKTERAQKRQKQSKHRRDSNKAREFFDTKADKKTERAQKRQKQSKST